MMRLPLRIAIRFVCAMLALTAAAKLHAKEPVRELPRAKPEDVGMSSKKLAKVDTIMELLVDEEKLAGGVVMIARQGKVAYLNAFGKMDRETDRPMKVDTIMRFYSMTKAITSTAVMMLVEEGKIDLDAPVSTYLPEFMKLRVQREDVVVAAKKPMLVKDLLRHTSGLMYGFAGDDPIAKAYREAKLLDRDRTLDEFSRRLAKIPLGFEPGSDWRYSVSIDVLGRIVEVVSKKTLDKFFAERIFQPLDMRDTGFYVPKEKWSRFAALYQSDGKGTLTLGDDPRRSDYLKPGKLLSGGGGLVSTARDYMRFLQMIAGGGQLHGKRLLKPETVQLMTTNQLPAEVPRIYFGAQIREGVGFGYGFSVRVKRSAWDPQGHVGEFGWGGAASTHYWVSPKDDLVVITLEQTMPYSFMTEFALKGTIYDAIEDKAPKKEPQAQVPGDAKRVLFLGDSITHAGHYVSMLELRLRLAGSEAELINLGLPSETCSGLSEPAHPFPRPDVHERLDRALTKVKPDLVVACYGMNDGIYHPFSEERFAAYKQGIDKLIEKVKASGAKLVLLTPPPFDPLPLAKKGKLVSKDGDKFAWFSIYDQYDSVLEKYSEWILKQGSRVDGVIDVRQPVLRYIERTRKANPDFTLSGDGVHINAEGHRILADAILKAWKFNPVPTDHAAFAPIHQRQMLMHSAWLTHVGHKRPGVKPGLPLSDAIEKATSLTKEIRLRVQH